MTFILAECSTGKLLTYLNFLLNNFNLAELSTGFNLAEVPILDDFYLLHWITLNLSELFFTLAELPTG